MKRIFVLLIATFLVGSSFPAVRAVNPGLWKSGLEGSQMKRHRERLDQVRAGGAPVVFLGDSITHFWEWDGHGKHVWGKYFSNGKRRAINLGTGGDRTEHVLWRLEHGELDGYEARCVVLLIGTNNTALPFGDEPPMDTILGVRRILDVITEKQPKARTILMAIFPCGYEALDEHRRRNETVNREIQKFADGEKVVWCDLSAYFLLPDGRLSYDCFTDLLHPGEMGYEIWASGVVPLIDKILTAGPGEVIPSIWSVYPRHIKAERWTPELPMSRFGRRGGEWSVRVLEIRDNIMSGQAGEYETVWVGDGTGIPPKGERVLDLSCCGDRVEHVLWRLENGHLEGYTAKTFVVNVGNNNTGNGGQFIALGVRRVLDVIQRKHPESKIVLNPLVAQGKKPEPRVVGLFADCNKIICKYADGKRIVWNHKGEAAE